MIHIRSYLSQFSNFFRKWFTAPQKTLIGPDRRNARLLAGLLLVIILGLLLSQITAPTAALSVVLVLFLPLYFLSRTQYYKYSAFITLIVFSLSIIFFFPLGDAAPTSYQINEVDGFVTWVALPVLIASMILSFRNTFILAIVNIVLLIVLPSIVPGLTLNVALGAAGFPLTIIPLILVAMRHRQQLEEERQTELKETNQALQKSESQLEQRVLERTRDLNVAADVARQITTVLDLNELLPRLTELTKKAFDLYFVSVFLYQPDSQALIIAAGTGDAGEKMLVEGIKFPLEARPSLVAKAGREKQNVVINDVSVNEAHAKNKNLPDTKSEIVLPMLVGNQLIGVLSLQSEYKDRFNPADVEIFSTLAEQIAIAINNAQLYKKQAQLAEELRQADQTKTQFLASMSHELRTPLNGIMNFTEMVALGMMGEVNKDQKDLLDQSLNSSKHLLDLINDVLDITKIQAGKLNLFIEDNVNLYDEISNVISIVKPMVREGHVNVVEDIDDNLPLISGDRRRIRQILLNLASNAAKFTDEGTITISAKNQSDHVLFAVIDTGKGILEEMHNVIFEPFIQTVDGIKHAQGTGLGLPITKSLVEAHGGRLWVESEPGDGSAFYVSLPVQIQEVTVV
jgi:signal transduction histidine kinase